MWRIKDKYFKKAIIDTNAIFIYVSRKYTPEQYDASNTQCEDGINNQGDSSYKYSIRYSLSPIDEPTKSPDEIKEDLIKRYKINPEPTFTDTLIAYLRKSNGKDSTFYRQAHIDRKLFSKIMSDKNYHPSKDTAISIAFALKLSLEEANALLNKAGYSLSHSIRRDIILEYMFKNEIYDVNAINQVLYSMCEKPLSELIINLRNLK